MFLRVEHLNSIKSFAGLGVFVVLLKAENAWLSGAYNMMHRWENTLTTPYCIYDWHVNQTLDVPYQVIQLHDRLLTLNGCYAWALCISNTKWIKTNASVLTSSLKWMVEHCNKVPINLCGFQVTESALWKRVKRTRKRTNYGTWNILFLYNFLRACRM